MKALAILIAIGLVTASLGGLAIVLWRQWKADQVQEAYRTRDASRANLSGVDET